ncbi:MAG: HAMP domain-containing histidine kinase [Chloroflexota bacterium]|nr:HAMP domain-containing histidine kinase [Chloroflexota bacterium]
MTIRTRLALTYGAAVVVTIAVVGLVVWWQFGIALRGALEQRLETRVAAVRSSLENQSQPGLQESGDEPGLFVAVIAADGTVLDASAGAPSPVPAATATGSTSEASSNGRRFLVRAEQVQGGLRVVAGADLAPIERSQGSLAGLLAIAGVLAAFLSAAGGWWLAGRALRPVAEITAEAAAIGASDLDRRLPQPSRPDELGVLARTLNGMLDRIGDAIKRQRSFLAAASHDLRTPLTALQTELELADRPESGPDELRAAVRAARDDAARLGELAGDLLQLASVSSDGRLLLRADVDLADLVETVVRRVAPVADRAGVLIRRTVDRRVVHIDRIRVEQALANLLVNAVTYSPPGGEAEIIGAPHPIGAGGFSIEVLDRGPGVPAEEWQAIFEPFQRGAAARGSGAGLGLATARAAVEAHGGRVTVEDRPGGGAAFRMRFPPSAG